MTNSFSPIRDKKKKNKKIVGVHKINYFDFFVIFYVKVAH